MQNGVPPRIVPRVVLELPRQELMRVLGDPAPLARLLRGLCDEHAFDGLVAPLNAPACVATCHCGRPTCLRNSANALHNRKTGGPCLVRIFGQRVPWTGLASFP